MSTPDRWGAAVGCGFEQVKLAVRDRLKSEKNGFYGALLIRFHIVNIGLERTIV
jgi:hypothetical protein